MERRRVVITGISAITPLGLDVASSWDALLAGKSGIDRITLFDSTGYDTQIAGEVKNFHPEDVIPAKVCRRMDRFVQFAVCGAEQLMKDSGYRVDENNAEQTGVILCVGNFSLFHSHADFEHGSGAGSDKHRRKRAEYGLDQRMCFFVACHRSCLFRNSSRPL